MKAIAITVLALCGLLATCVPAYADPAYPAGFDETALATGLTAPTMVDWAPDGRMFVAEKGGVLKVVPAGSDTARTVVDLSDRVNSAWDRGLLGLALDADFAQNGYVYLLYSREIRPLTPDSNEATVSRLTRITVGTDNRVANPSSPETVLLGKDEPDLTNTYHPCPPPSDTSDCIPSEEVSHSIGTVRAAPDGTLYVGSGDASDYGRVDPYALQTMDERTYRGKIVHIDRNGRGLPGHAFCPTDTNLDHVCTKVHAKGFRNPFRFQLMPDGRLAVADVGWNTYEELDIVGAAGRNYGWPCYEADSHTPGYDQTTTCQALYGQGTASPPAHSYDHDHGAAILAGPVYRGNDYPAGYRDSLFIGDYVGGFVQRADVNAAGAVTAVHPFATGWTSVALEEAPGGDLVHVDFGDGSPGTGSVRQVSYAPGRPRARATATPDEGAPPLAVQFDASTSSDAEDGSNLTYAWAFGDGATGTGATPSHTYTTAGEYSARVTATDSTGQKGTASVHVRVGNRSPAPVIDTPSTGAPYSDGEQVTVQGSATDPDEGALPGSALSWQVLLHHGTSHIHPVAQGTGYDVSFATVRDHDSDSWYEVRLTATDDKGAQGTAVIELRPRTSSLTIRSTPAGAPIAWAGQTSADTRTYAAARGFESTVTAPATFSRDGRSYRFASWSDGGQRSHDVTVGDSAATLEARYDDVTPSASPVGDPAPSPNGTAPDRRPPSLRLTARTLVAARGAAVRGTASDSSGIARVDVGLSRPAGRRCRWWSSRHRRTSTAHRSCRSPAWMRAATARRGGTTAWRIAPWRIPPVGLFGVWVRATDRAGNTRVVHGRLAVETRPRAVVPILRRR